MGEKFGLNETTTISVLKNIAIQWCFHSVAKLYFDAHPQYGDFEGCVKFSVERWEKQKTQRTLTSCRKEISQTNTHMDIFLLSLWGIDLFFYSKSDASCFISLLWCTMFLSTSKNCICTQSRQLFLFSLPLSSPTGLHILFLFVVSPSSVFGIRSPDVSFCGDSFSLLNFLNHCSDLIRISGTQVVWIFHLPVCQCLLLFSFVTGILFTSQRA